MTAKHEITAKRVRQTSLELQRQFCAPLVRYRLLAALLLISFLAFIPKAVNAQTTVPVAICYGAASPSLIPIAKHRDFYAAEGISVELLPFPSGKQAMEALFAGKCAFAATAESPVVHHSLSRNDFSVIAAIAISNSPERIVVRSDRGILAPANLSGRRIAVPEFTTAHYFLDMYLAANGLASKDVTKVYLPAQDVIQAFRRGDVDAAAHWEPNIQTLATEFGARAKVLTSPGLHINPLLLTGMRDYLNKNPARVERVLRALLRAERWTKDQPANAKVLMARDCSTSLEEIELIWSLNDFRVTLDQSLVFILENAARWEIGLTPPAQRPTVPNYLDFIDVDGLKKIKPEVVTIFH